MKFFSIFVLIALFSSAFSSENIYPENGQKLKTECRVKLLPRGIWWTECPRGTLSAGTDAQVTRVPFVQTRVSCYEPTVECETVEDTER